MDCARTEGERTINHHGKPREVGGDGESGVVRIGSGVSLGAYLDMTQRDEEAKVSAVKDFYDNAEVDDALVQKLDFIGK